MSQWTHVSGIIRVDSIVDRGVTKEKEKKLLEDFLGPICSYDDEESSEQCHLPCGSEGSLRYEVSITGHANEEPGYFSASVSRGHISIWGDLRDYNDFQEILNWFKSLCSSIQKEIGYWVRDSILTIDVEFKKYLHCFYDTQLDRIVVLDIVITEGGAVNVHGGY